MSIHLVFIKKTIVYKFNRVQINNAEEEEAEYGNRLYQ